MAIAFDQANALQLRENCQLYGRGVGESSATRQIDVADTVTHLDLSNDSRKNRMKMLKNGRKDRRKYDRKDEFSLQILRFLKL
jgi:hypothetical protein